MLQIKTNGAKVRVGGAFSHAQFAHECSKGRPNISKEMRFGHYFTVLRKMEIFRIHISDQVFEVIFSFWKAWKLAEWSVSFLSGFRLLSDENGREKRKEIGGCSYENWLIYVTFTWRETKKTGRTWQLTQRYGNFHLSNKKENCRWERGNFDMKVVEQRLFDWDLWISNIFCFHKR